MPPSEELAEKNASTEMTLSGQTDDRDSETVSQRSRWTIRIVSVVTLAAVVTIIAQFAEWIQQIPSVSVSGRVHMVSLLESDLAIDVELKNTGNLPVSIKGASGIIIQRQPPDLPSVELQKIETMSDSGYPTIRAFDVDFEIPADTELLPGRSMRCVLSIRDSANYFLPNSNFVLLPVEAVDGLAPNAQAIPSNFMTSMTATVEVDANGKESRYLNIVSRFLVVGSTSGMWSDGTSTGLLATGHGEIFPKEFAELSEFEHTRQTRSFHGELLSQKRKSLDSIPFITETVD